VTTSHPPRSLRALSALIACSAIAALALAAMAAPAPADARQIFIFGGNTTVQLDAALLTPYGIVVERRGSAKPSPAGLRFKIVDGRTTLEYPPAGKVLTVGSMALV
jgi:hypothetical protein